MSNTEKNTAGAERQFLLEASNRAGRVAGHNNKLAQRLAEHGLVMAISRGIVGQRNYHITDLGIRALGVSGNA